MTKRTKKRGKDIPTTFNRQMREIVARSGVCSACGEWKPLVAGSKDAMICRECFDERENKWNHACPKKPSKSEPRGA